MKLLILLMLLFPLNCLADDFASFGLGLFNSQKGGTANVKFGEIGHRDDIGLGFFNQYSGGGWFQEQTSDGRKSSGFAGDQLGIRSTGFVSTSVAIGPSLITSPDSYLGGIFQFHESIFVGFTGTEGNTIGFTYEHFSSAGLETPNQGRDFGCLTVNVPW